jgi:hypothetical protein
VTPNIGFTELAFPLPEPVVERPATSRILLSPPLGNSQSSQVNPLDVASVDLPCDGSSSGEPQTALHPTALDCSPCLADAALEIETSVTGASDDVELFVTGHVTYADHRLPPGLMSSLSSPDAADRIDLPSLDSDAHFTPCESHSYEVRTPEPALSPTFGALLSPLLSVDNLARDSSPLHPEPDSDAFMRSTPPLSSPRMECNVAVIEDPAREAGRTSDHARIDYYPTTTMSSPSFALHGNESLFSPSPPHRVPGAKRALYDDSDEVRCQKRTCGFI